MTTERAIMRPIGQIPDDSGNQDLSVRVDDTVYAHASGRVRALETRLMDSVRTQRMTEAADTIEFGRYLADAGYPLMETNGLSLIQYYSDTCNEIRKLAPEKEYVDLFFLQADVMNTKLFLKYHVGLEQVPYEDLDRRISRPSNSDPAKLFEAIRDRDNSEVSVPEWLWKAGQCAYEEYTSSGDSAHIDICLDRAYARESVRMARILDNEWFTRLVTMRIDLANMEMVFRQRRAGFTKEYAAESLLPDGEVPCKKIEDLLGRPEEVLTSAWNGTTYSELATETMGDYNHAGGPARFGKRVDDLVMGHVKKAHRIAFGPEVLVGYLYAIHTEVRNARMILTFIRNHLDPADARELLRETYV